MERTNPNIISFSKPSEEDLKRLDELTLGKNSVNSSGKMSFVIICNECGSNNTQATVENDYSITFKCYNCGHEENESE